MNIVIILIILLVGAIFTYCSGNRLASKVAIFFSVVATIFSIALLVKHGMAGADCSIVWVHNPHINFALKVDGLSIAMVLLTTIALPIILLMSLARNFKNERILYSLVMFMAFAMVGAFLSSDALLYYVFWELSLIPIYFIIVFWGNGDILKRKRAAMKFFIYTFAGSLFMLAAILYVGIQAGSFSLHDFYHAHLSHTAQICVFIAFFLAYAVKIPIFPFHTWQANAYQKAPAIGTMLLAVLMSKMGAYSIIRWQLPITPYASHTLRMAALILCIISVLYGTIIALRQDNIKRFFAYASLAHVGFIAAGIYALSYDGLQGAVILMLAHGFTTLGLFYSADIIYDRTHQIKISCMGGIRARASKFSLAFFLCILASIALPLTMNLLGEFQIMYGLSQLSLWYTLFVGLSVFLGAFMMLRMFQGTMLGKAPKEPFRDLHPIEVFLFVIIVAILFFFGIYSKPITALLKPSLETIIMYIN